MIKTVEEALENQPYKEIYNEKIDINKLLEDKLKEIENKKELFVNAFIAETGLKPSEVVQYQQNFYNEDGLISKLWYVKEEKPTIINPPASIWISVKDRLPEPSLDPLYVLVHLDGGNIQSMYVQFDELKIYFIDDNETNYSSFVTHWMPLPKLPENQE